MWFRKMTFTGTADTFSISVEKGQTVYLQCYAVNIRMANYEQDLADGMNHFVIPCDTSNKGLSPFNFISDVTAILYFTPDSDAGAVLSVMVLDV